MMIVRFIDSLIEKIKAVRWLLVVVMVVVVLVDAFLVDKHHAHTKAEHYPLFWAAFGFGAGVVFIFLARWFGQLGIMTRENYYD